MRAVLILGAALGLSHAPMQCQREPDPTLRRQETPGEALYQLSEQFKARGEEAAWRRTLEYLIARYPSSREAHMAREDLAGAPPKTP